MVSKSEFLQFAAQTLGVAAETLTLESSYGEIPAWDSIAHLRLVMEIGAKYGVSIPFSDITRVRSLWEFWRRINGAPIKKVIAVDLDDTLWKGVIGEDESVRPDLSLQSRLKALKERGTLLVALSKNDQLDVEWFLGEQPAKGCSLCGSDFVARRINWRRKADNLREIAAELNLAPDAFVFIDDNPAERLEMTALCPEVAVAEFPPNPEAYFPERELTDEDSKRTEEYRAEAARRRLAASCAPDDYLRELEIWTDIHAIRAEEVPRVAQLSQRANQFNVCVHRYTESEVRELMADAEHLIVTARTGDRFGSQGLVAYVHVCRNEIVDWVMSCRVMNRGIEDAVEAWLEAELRARGVSELNATWRRAERNLPVKGLFERLGFAEVSSSESERRFVKYLK